MQNFERFEKGGKIINARNTEALKKGRGTRVAPRERGGMRNRPRLRLSRFTDLERDKRNILGCCSTCKALPS